MYVGARPLILSPFIFPDTNSIVQPNGTLKAIDVVSGANDYEKKLLEACYKGLKGNIEKGIDFANSPQPAQK